MTYFWSLYLNFNFSVKCPFFSEPVTYKILFQLLQKYLLDWRIQIIHLKSQDSEESTFMCICHLKLRQTNSHLLPVCSDIISMPRLLASDTYNQLCHGAWMYVHYKYLRPAPAHMHTSLQNCCHSFPS